MKICHIGCGYLPYSSGNSIRVMNLIHNLASDFGVESEVVTYTPDAQGLYPSKKVPDADRAVNVYRYKGFFAMLWSVIKILFTQKIDVFHTHSVSVMLTVSVLRGKRPLILEIHGLPKLSGLKMLIYGLALRIPQYIIVLSDTAKNYLVNTCHLPAEKIKVILNGIDVERFSRYYKYSPFSGTCRIGYVGSFYEWQGVLDFVAAVPLVLEKNTKVEFHMIGNGPALQAAKQKAQETGAQNKIIFAGHISHQSMPEALDNLDIIAIPRPSTLATETTVPLKVFEFMAAGKAIIASDVGGLVEILHPGQDCITYRAGHIDQLADAMLRLASDPNLCQALGNRALENVRRHAGWGEAAKSLMDIYCDLTGIAIQERPLSMDEPRLGLTAGR
jgi:glycosyltransferase involved in cell wall biosynthesis